jgi:hypothetical protein
MTSESGTDHMGVVHRVKGGRPPRRSRRLRGMSIRGLMLFSLVVGGWLGWVCHQARVQREAVAAVRRAGSVTFDWQWNNGAAAGNEPGWLRRQLGPGRPTG